MTVSYEAWREGDAVAVGRALLDALPPAEQVARAVAVLDICRARCPSPREVDDVAEVGRDPSRWREGHARFDAVRTLTLKAEGHPDRLYRMLLHVAEIVAKVVYNASGAPAPFDANSVWWLPRNARDFAAALDDEEVWAEIWASLRGRTPDGLR